MPKIAKLRSLQPLDVTHHVRLPFRLLELCLCVLSFFGHIQPAAAHDPFELTTTGRLSSSGLTFVTTTTRGGALALVDPERPRGAAFPPEDLPRLRPRLAAAAARLFEVSQDGKQLVPLRTDVALTVEQEIELTVVYPAPRAGSLKLVATHVQKLGSNYASALTLTQDEPASVLGTAVFTSDAAELTVQVLPNAPLLPSARVEASSGARLGFGRAFVLGVEHILAGIDHLLFLAGVLVACRRARAMLAIVTAFSVAHSLTLALAASQLVIIPAAVIEPLIAASIVLVGVENLRQKDGLRGRVAICFGFGLVHGFGFAGALRELTPGLGGAGLAVPLLGFNLGVEGGQLLIVAVLLPILLLARKSSWASRWLLPASSLAVAAAGLYWFVERTLLS